MAVKENNEPIMARAQNEADTSSEISPLTADTRPVTSNINLEGIARTSEENIENMESLCNTIAGDAPLFTMFRKDGS